MRRTRLFGLAFRFLAADWKRLEVKFASVHISLEWNEERRRVLQRCDLWRHRWKGALSPTGATFGVGVLSSLDGTGH